MNLAQKKILIFSYYWPPAGGSGVQRWMYFAKYLKQLGYEPIIITVDEKKASYPVIDSSLIKETNRLLALKNEIKKLGTDIVITSDTLSFNNPNQINNNVTIQTYEDHRMAMAFAPLSVLTNIIIKDPDVVSKSYPNFWNDLTKLGITINKS